MVKEITVHVKSFPAFYPQRAVPTKQLHIITFISPQFSHGVTGKANVSIICFLPNPYPAQFWSDYFMID